MYAWQANHTQRGLSLFYVAYSDILFVLTVSTAPALCLLAQPLPSSTAFCLSMCLWQGWACTTCLVRHTHIDHLCIGEAVFTHEFCGFGRVMRV